MEEQFSQSGQNDRNFLRGELPHRKIYHESLGLDPDWDFHFEMNNFLYFKNSFTNELDQVYGDIYEQIINLEQEILRNIEEEVRSRKNLSQKFNFLKIILFSLQKKNEKFEFFNENKLIFNLRNLNQINF